MSAPLDVDAVERGLAGLLATHPHLGGLSDALAPTPDAGGARG